MSTDLSAWIDTQPYWVIWQVGSAPTGGRRIRRVFADYRSEVRANADAERLGKSGAITWVEEIRPLAPAHVPAEAIAWLGGGDEPGAKSVAAIGSRRGGGLAAPAI